MCRALLILDVNVGSLFGSYCSESPYLFRKKLKNNCRDNLVSVSRDTLISNLVIKSGV